MDIQISEIINVCRELGSEKGPERKKAGVKLKNLLNRSSVKKALDKNYELKYVSKNSGKVFTWENVFKAVCIYVSMETNDVKNASENVSRTTLSNRENRLREASALYKYVIRSADKGSPKLKGSAVISYIVETLRDPYSCSSHGQDFCSILLKNILSTRKYVVELNSKDWHELLFLFFKLYHDRETKIDRLLLSRVIHSLVSSATQQCDVRAKKVLHFFTEFFKTSGQERSVMLLEHMVSALNTFLRAIAPDSRTQICKLGEEIFSNILYLWHNVASEELKEHLIEFLQTQMWAHHPGGHKQGSDAALAVDWDRWLSSLRKLYEILYMEMQQLASKTRNKDCMLKPSYIDLAVDVCQQLFSSTSDIIEVTQTAGGSGDTQPGPRAKKRRLESGWAAVRDFIATAGQSVKLIPWTQLVTRLVEKYTDSLPSEEVVPYLQVLSNIMADCKRTDLMQYIMRCLESFVKSWDKITTSPKDLVAVQSQPVWEKIWAGTLRFVALHHAEAEGYKLLTCLLEKKLVTPGKEIWSLFVPMVTQPVEESVEFLSRYLAIHDLPEKYQTGLFGSMSENVESSIFPLRNQLIDWLIPANEEDCDSPRSVSHLNSDWTAYAMVTLTLRNPASSWLRPEEPIRNFLTSVEETYLNTALVSELTFEKLLLETSGTNMRGDVVHIPVLLKKVEDVLKGQVQYYCNKIEYQLCHIEEMCTYCYTLARLLFILLEYNILSAETVTQSGFCDLLTSLMKKMLSAISDFVKTDGIVHLKPVISRLERLFSSIAANVASDSCCVMAQLLRAMLPAKVVDLILDIAVEKVTLKSSTSNQSDTSLNQSRLNHTSSGGRARLLDDFDDMDLEFDAPSANNNNDVDNDLDFDDDLGESQESDDVVVADGASHSLLSGSCLSESQQLRLEAITFLCHWCSYDQPSAVTLPIKCDRDVKYTRSKVIKLLQDDAFDPSRAADLQMLKWVVQTLTSGTHILRDEDFLILLEAVKNVMRLHRRDQELCCTSLDMLMRLCICMESEQDDSLCSQEKQDGRILMLHLVNAFWKLQSEGNYTSSVRLYLAKFMAQLVKLDPRCEWSKFPGEEDGGGGDSSLQPAYRLVECGADYAHNIRMFVTSALPQLFICNRTVNGSKTATAREYQDQMFGQIYDVLTDSLDIQGRLSAEKLQDERSNRVSSTLIGLGTVMCVSPVCEKKAVFAICQLMKEKNIETELVKQLLDKVSKVLGYKTSTSFLESHLPFLVHEWLSLKYSITEFPYKLLGCESSQHFYRSYLSELIPELVVNKDLQTVQEIALSLDQDWKEILRDCVPKILVHILPLFAASRLSETGEDEIVKRRTSKATACYDMLISEISNEVVDKQIVTCLDEMVVNILMCLYDSDDLDESIRNLDPQPNPPFYNSYNIKTTLDYLTKSFSGSGKSLVEILCKSPDSIQKILLSLSTHLMSSHRIHCKRRLLLMYQLFTRLLLREFHNQLGGAWAFVMRDIIFRLLHLVKEVRNMKSGGLGLESYVEDITCMTVELLREVCSVATDVCPQELRKYLPMLSSNLIPLVTVTNSFGEQSKGLLEFLILEKASVLRESIAALDPFPEKPVFANCSKMHQKLKYSAGKFTLKQEVEHFLSLSHDHDAAPEFRLEGLKFLNTKLTEESKQIESLAEGDVLSRLICELVHLSKCRDQKVLLEAGKCLGCIGPVNLNTLSLPWRQDSPGLEIALRTFQEVPDVQKYCYIFHLLNKYLTDLSIETVCCASEVLKLMLSVKTGIEFSQGYKAQLGDTEYLFHYLHPFRSPRKKPVHIPGPSRSWDVFQASVDQESLWNPRHGNYVDWLTTLTVTLIQSGAVKDELLRLLVPVCQRKVEFCETVLPYLIHDILLSGNNDHREVLSRQADNFFSCHCGHTSGRISRCQSTMSASLQLDQGEEYICMNVKAVRILLDMVQYLRQQTRPKQGRSNMTQWDNNFWLDVNYLQMAKAAQYCSAHFSTVLLAEIWCDLQRDQSETSQPHSGSRGSQSSRHSQETLSQSLSDDTRIDTLSGASSCPSGVNVKDLLYEAYRWIGDPDGVYGCGAGRQADAMSRIRQYQHEDQWDKAVITCDIQMNQTNSIDQTDVLQALQNFGSSHILDTYLQGMMGDLSSLPPDTRELQFEAAWKMGQWNLDTPNRLSADAGFHQSVFSSLKAIKEDHYSFAVQAVQKARLCCLNEFQEGSMESSRRLFPVLAGLQCVSILDNVAGARQFDNIRIPVMTNNQDVDFEFKLPALNMSCSALDMLYLKSDRKEALPSLVKHLQGLSQQARMAGRHQIAERAIQKLSSLEISDLDLQIPTQIEETRLYWSRSEENIAKHLMRNLIDRLRKMKAASPIAVRFYPQALSIYGNWLADTRSENPNVIMEKYLEKTVKLLERLGNDQDTALDAYLSLGRYADSQYQNIVMYMKSSTFEAKQSLLTKAQEEAEKLREVMGQSGKDRYQRLIEKQTAIDEQELANLVNDRKRFLLKAVENYIKCLKCGDQHNLRVFRLTSLWFNNVGIEEVNTMMQGAVASIKSYKWLPLMYQLAARMDVKPQRDTSDKFLSILNKIISETAVTHPHHTLFCVLALANANRDTELMQQSKSTTSKRGSKLSKSQTETAGDEEGRVQAAKNMVEKLLQDRKVGAYVQEMKTLCDAYIQLANWGVSQYKTETKPIQLPSALWISKIKDLKHIPVPTTNIKVDPSGSYTGIAYIHKFEPTFKLAGGINLPKIISCIGSDGKKSRQLVKGRDDLRQDAVMQQVFDMVNNLLQKNSETRKRQLQIRKYKVIPLSQRSGLLEWCEGTQPIGEYLIGGGGVKGAHTRYRPQDWPAYQSREHLQSGDTVESKYKVYAEICTNFRPVFRHFFMERFSKPAIWFERRLAYTRSVATNSIVGYILGLGDRHVQNILIDCNTAELVHIDLGVAFEMGKILPTPETVPFRLTRDIEDGMGVSGVEGVYRRCCEKTMEVMRNNQEALLTILEVLLYDPLYAWTISPAKAYALQQTRNRNDQGDTLDVSNTTGDLMDLVESSNRTNSETQENVNKLAERVLLRLHQKLQGVEDGIQLSLSGQVNHLIQEARNPKNLARLFSGWQPYI